MREIVTKQDAAALGLSTLSFTLLLACYYILRPVRDALAATVC